MSYYHGQENTVIRLNKKIADLEDIQEKNKKEIHKQNIGILCLRNDIRELTEERNTLRKENSELKKRIHVSEKGDDSEKVTNLEKLIAGLEAKKVNNAKVVLNLQQENSSLQENMKKLQEKAKVLESENVDLKEKICFGRKFLIDEKTRLEKVFEPERKGLQTKIFTCETVRTETECESTETINVKLSKQISDFEKVLILEREKFEKERTYFETERKSLNAKLVELSIKLSDLEKALEIERKVSEKKKVEVIKVKSDKAKSLEDDFEKERKIFKSEVSKLTKRLSELSTEIMKEKKFKSDLEKKFDFILKERNVFADNVKKLEDKISQVESSEQTSPVSIVQTPCDDSADSECSFKTTSSSAFKIISSKRFIKSNDFSND